MSRAIGGSLLTHIGSQVTTLATCWRLETVVAPTITLGFTNHTRDLVIDGLTYQAETGIIPTTSESAIGVGIDNMDIQSILDSAQVNERDMMAGRYDFAKIEVFLVNYLDLTQGKITMHKGTLGEVSVFNNAFVAEARGFMQQAAQQIGRLTLKSCRVRVLGDTYCRLADSITGGLAGNTEDTNEPITYNGTVNSVTSRRQFASTAANHDTSTIPVDDSDPPETYQLPHFTNGTVEFLTGNNTGRRLEVKTFNPAGGIFVMQEKFPYDIVIGDTFTAIAGCDRAKETCRVRFNNVQNFQGEPDLPGLDKVLIYRSK
jgi:uncharacterized phage protein (TIGR02218 family)